MSRRSGDAIIQEGIGERTEGAEALDQDTILPVREGGSTPLTPSDPVALAREKAKAAAQGAATAEDDARKALEDALHAENENYLKRLGRATFIVSFVALALMLVLSVAAAGGFSESEDRWATIVAASWGEGGSKFVLAAAAALVLWIVLGGLALAMRTRGRLSSLLIGKDGRFSTTQFQTWIWTIVVVWVLLYLQLVAASTRMDVEYDVEGTLFGINPDYLILIGGPFAALLISQQVEQTKTAAGTLQKVEASEARFSDLFSNDSRRADLVDTQFLLFNVVALMAFFAALIGNGRALPDIPDQFLLLTSGAALGYVTRKAILRNAPSITSIVAKAPDVQATIGGDVLISGVNLVPAGGGSELFLSTLTVKFGDSVVKPTLQGSTDAEVTAGSSAVQVLVATVPDLSGDGKTERAVDVVVRTAAGSETPAFTIRVASRVLPIRLEPMTVASGTATVTLKLLDDTLKDRPVRVALGEAVFDSFWDDAGRLSLQLPTAMVDGRQLSVSSGGAAFTAQLFVPAG